MEKLKFKQEVVKRKATSDFALQIVAKRTGTIREYLVGGEWTSESPKSKPEDFRFVFDGKENFRSAVDSYLAWNMLASSQYYPAEFPTAALQRLTDSRLTQTPLTLFIPWGVRPEGNPSTEIDVLKKVKDTQEKLASRLIPTDVLIMPADLYATEVNNQVKTEDAHRYFNWVTDYCKSLGFTVKPWSEIRAENLDQYSKRSTELTNEELESILGNGTIVRAFGAAGRRSGYEEQSDIQKAAYSYLRERICEAEIIEDVFQPIKISMVVKYKDALVDRALPRLYLLPPELQFPWLK